MGGVPITSLLRCFKMSRCLIDWTGGGKGFWNSHNSLLVFLRGSSKVACPCVGFYRLQGAGGGRNELVRPLLLWPSTAHVLYLRDRLAFY